jgi:hypothetical protein
MESSGNVIISTDEVHLFFRGAERPPSSFPNALVAWQEPNLRKLRFGLGF